MRVNSSFTGLCLIWLTKGYQGLDAYIVTPVSQLSQVPNLPMQPKPTPQLKEGRQKWQLVMTEVVLKAWQKWGTDPNFTRERESDREREREKEGGRERGRMKERVDQVVATSVHQWKLWDCAGFLVSSLMVCRWNMFESLADIGWERHHQTGDDD